MELLRVTPADFDELPRAEQVLLLVYIGEREPPAQPQQPQES